MESEDIVCVGGGGLMESEKLIRDSIRIIVIVFLE